MGDHLLVVLELPGVEKDDINLEFCGKKLVVFGTKKLFKAYDNSQNIIRQESDFGEFRRRVKVGTNQTKI
jgi:HSP20 family molecular chaperone IbpA